MFFVMYKDERISFYKDISDWYLRRQRIFHFFVKYSINCLYKQYVYNLFIFSLYRNFSGLDTQNFFKKIFLLKQLDSVWLPTEKATFRNIYVFNSRLFSPLLHTGDVVCYCFLLLKEINVNQILYSPSNSLACEDAFPSSCLYFVVCVLLER